jgi:hypothetical protein
MPSKPASLACVVFAHQDPTQLHRLIDALDPFPVFLHVDARTPDDLFHEMTRDLPGRVRLLDRVATPWARWGIVHAEIEAYRRALAETDATHVALLTGADYPLATTDEISALLDDNRDHSFTAFVSLPHHAWRGGGFSRIRYPWLSWRKRSAPVPIPRRLPKDVALWGGSTHKVLARKHAEAVVRVADERKDLVRYWKPTWTPDETFIPSILNSPQFVPDWEDEHTETWLWWVGWEENAASKSPPWITERNLGVLLSRRWAPDYEQPVPFMFARKFSSVESATVLDTIDAELLGRGPASDADATPEPEIARS